MIGYLKEFNDSMTMSLRADDSKLFKKYCKIWKTIKGLLGIQFDSEPVYGDTDFYIKTKVKMYDNKVNTNFRGKETLKGDSSYKCLLLIMSDSVVKVGKEYYPQGFLEEQNVSILKERIRCLIILMMTQKRLTQMMIMDGLYSESASESDSDSNN